jgi:hypothetical protein
VEPEDSIARSGKMSLIVLIVVVVGVFTGAVALHAAIITVNRHCHLGGMQRLLGRSFERRSVSSETSCRFDLKNDKMSSLQRFVSLETRNRRTSTEEGRARWLNISHGVIVNTISYSGDGPVG